MEDTQSGKFQQQNPLLLLAVGMMHLLICVELYCCVEDGWGRFSLCRILVVLSHSLPQWLLVSCCGI